MKRRSSWNRGWLRASTISPSSTQGTANPAGEGELEYPGSSVQGREPLVNQQDNHPALGAGGSVTNRACGVGLVTPAVVEPTGSDQNEVYRHTSRTPPHNVVGHQESIGQ